MRKVLVTGAGGFIGRHVVAALAGRTVIATAHGPSGRTDLLESGAAKKLISKEKPELLIHLAWETTHGRFWTSPDNARWVEASTELFDAFFAAGGERAVGLGSCAEYDWTMGADTYPEDAPLAPHSPYGAAKVVAHEALRVAADRHNASHAWGRIFFSFGMGEPPGRLIPLMLKAVLDRQPLDIGPSDAVRDFWDVRDLGASIAALALSDAEGPVNLGLGQGLRFGELAGMIERIAGVDDIIHPDRRPLGKGEPLCLVPDVSLLRRDVSFTPQYDVHHALTEYYERLVGTPR